MVHACALGDKLKSSASVQVNALDIESTLRHVVEMVVMDPKLSKADKKRMAQGIMRLGKVFMQPM